jgi:hypothetical protein
MNKAIVQKQKYRLQLIELKKQANLMAGIIHVMEP